MSLRALFAPPARAGMRAPFALPARANLCSFSASRNKLNSSSPEDWGRARSALRWYKQRKGHLLVPRSFVMGPEEARESGLPLHVSQYPLGNIVKMIRAGGHLKGHPERESELKELGFVWNVPDYMYSQIVLPALRWHKEKHLHLDVPQGFKMSQEDVRQARLPSHLTSYTLGAKVRNIRFRGDHIQGHPERESELGELGFIWDTIEHRYANVVLPALRWFKQNRGHLLVPSEFQMGPKELREAGLPPHVSRRYHLGNVVHSIRRQASYIEGHPERRADLEMMGFVWNVADYTYSQVLLPSLRWYKRKHAHLDVPTIYAMSLEEVREAGLPDHMSDYNLGQIVGNIRARGDHIVGRPERRRELEELGFGPWRRSPPRTVPAASSRPPPEL